MTGAGSTATPARTAVIVAPDALQREQVRRALDAAGIAVLAEFDHAADVGTDVSPDALILLTDDGATARASMIRRLRRIAGHVIVVAPNNRRHHVRSALEAGAAGFLFDTDLHAIGATIEAACAGQIAVPRLSRRQLDQPTLSVREKQILGLVVMGYMNCEIAERLFLAESTIKSHLSSAFAKLGVRSRNEAVDVILAGEDGLGRGILAITGESALPAASRAA